MPRHPFMHAKGACFDLIQDSSGDLNLSAGAKMGRGETCKLYAYGLQFIWTGLAGSIITEIQEGAVQFRRPTEPLWGWRKCTRSHAVGFELWLVGGVDCFT